METNPFQAREQGDKTKREGDNSVWNKNQLEDLKMKREGNWRSKFAGALMGNRPFWDKSNFDQGGASICTRWHIRGDCFEDYNNKVNHVGKDKIP